MPSSPTRPRESNPAATWSLVLALGTTVTCAVTAVPSLWLALRALRAPGSARDTRLAWAAVAVSTAAIAVAVSARLA